MNSSSWIVFRRLLEQNPPRKQSAFASFLSHEERERLQQTPSAEGNPFAHIYTMEQRLSIIHYSWLITFLEPFAEKDKLMILAALHPKQVDKLQSYFKIKDSPFSIKPFAKKYLVQAIYDWLISDQKEFLPFEFLPEHPLNELLTLNKRELQALVDYLGLHDLALELKHVIKADQIKKIQQVLSKDEQSYLKTLLKVKEPLSFARLNLDKWNGDGPQLKAILHHRGFNRLAKALFGCHPSLLWHISHRLDTGRSKILRKFFTDINNEEAHQILISQILGLIPIIQKTT